MSAFEGVILFGGGHPLTYAMMTSMDRFCTFCGTKLPGRKGHGFATKDGGISCGRSQTQKTVTRNGSLSLALQPLPCADAVRA